MKTREVVFLRFICNEDTISLMQNSGLIYLFSRPVRIGFLCKPFLIYMVVKVDKQTSLTHLFSIYTMTRKLIR